MASAKELASIDLGIGDIYGIDCARYVSVVRSPLRKTLPRNGRFPPIFQGELSYYGYDFSARLAPTVAGKDCLFGAARGLFFTRRKVALWDTCSVRQDLRSLDPLREDVNLRNFWEAFERFIKGRQHNLETFFARSENPNFSSQEWQDFLLGMGYSPMEGGGFWSKETRPN